MENILKILALPFLLVLFATLGLSAQTSPAQATLREVMRLDGVREDFSSVNSVVVSKRGDIALAMRRDAEVRIYSPQGQRLATVGRRGAGPGEFQNPQVQGWLADTLWIFDFSLRRHTYVDRGGRLLRTVALDAELKSLRDATGDESARFSNFFPRSRRDNVSILGTINATRKSSTSAAGSRREGVAIEAGGRVRFLIDASDDARWQWDFGPAAALAFSGDGQMVASARVTDLAPSGAHVKLLVVDVSGRKLLDKEISYTGVAMPRRLIDSVLKVGVGIDRVHSIPADRIPPVFPPVESLILESTGNLWFTTRIAESSRIIKILDKSARTIASFPIPANAYLVDARGANVWLKTQDDDGVHSVVHYQLFCGKTLCIE